MPHDLPSDFPRGPWIVDFSKDPDHTNTSGCHDAGWRYQEEQMIMQWKVWASDPLTPREYDETKYVRGGFVLAGTTRTGATSCSGTVKRVQCTGRTEEHKGTARACSFKVMAEFVTEVLPGLHGWVLRNVEGTDHMLVVASDSKPVPHALVQSRAAAMDEARLRQGVIRLKQTEYFKTGMRMKAAGLSCTMIHDTLKAIADEEGREAQWNIQDIKEVFGTDSKESVCEKKSGPQDNYCKILNISRHIATQLQDDDEETERFLQFVSKYEKAPVLPPPQKRKRQKKNVNVGGEIESGLGGEVGDGLGGGAGGPAEATGGLAMPPSHIPSGPTGGATQAPLSNPPRPSHSDSMNAASKNGGEQ